MTNPEFLLASLIVMLILGTGVMYTITAGLTPWDARLGSSRIF